MKNKKFLILVILAIFCMGVTIASVSADGDDAVPALEKYSQGCDGKQVASNLQKNRGFTAGTAGNLCGCQHELCSLHLWGVLII